VSAIDRKPIYVRAYAVPDDLAPPNRSNKRKRSRWRPRALLVFDTETSIDVVQRFCFGCYRYYRVVGTGARMRLVCIAEGLVHADDLEARDPDGLAALKAYSPNHAPAVDRTVPDTDPTLRLRSRADFVRRILIPAMENPRIWIVGFNLAFDVARIATDATAITRTRRPMLRGFIGGFAFTLDPAVHGSMWIKTIDSKKHFYAWNAKGNRHTGHFLDVRTLAVALSGENQSLNSTCKTFAIIDPTALAGVISALPADANAVCRSAGADSTHDLASLLSHDRQSAVERVLASDLPIRRTVARLLAEFTTPWQKRDVSHGTIDDTYIEYNRDDVWATAEAATALLRDYQAAGIWVSPTKAYSSASITKDLQDRMGIAPLRERHHDLDPQLLGFGMVGFYGGRVESHIRGAPLPGCYVDATSMYPAGAVLLDLHRFDRYRNVDIAHHDGADHPEVQRAQRLLDALTIDRILDRAIHPQLVFFGLVEPQPGDALPARCDYADDGTLGIGINHLQSSEQPVWYAGPDLAASAVLTGRVPRLHGVITFEFSNENQELRRVRLPDGSILDPRHHDPNRRLIEARKRLKRSASATAERQRRGDRFLKVVANSLYGITAEMNREARGKSLPITVHGLGSFPDSKVPELPGDFFNAFRAALTTSWARLVLAALERLIHDAGGEYIAMDTDSAIIVSTPSGGLHPCTGGQHRLLDGPAVLALNYEQVDQLLARFDAINAFDPEIVPHFWKVEDVNYENSDAASPRRQLWCISLSSKRYMLYTYTSTGTVEVIASWDGMDEATGQSRETLTLPTDHTSVGIVDRREHGLGHLIDPTNSDEPDLATQVWQYVERVLKDPNTPLPRWASLPARTRLSISTPALLGPFAAYNRGKPYADQIKPFNFLDIPHPRDEDAPRLVGPAVAHRHDATNSLYFAKGTDGSVVHRITTGRADPSDPTVIPVRTYSDVIKRYLDHPEPKSLGPDQQPCDSDTRGVLTRRRLVAVTALHIGKEANNLERRRAGILEPEDVTIYRPRDDPTWTHALAVLSDFSSRQISHAIQEGGLSPLAPEVAATVRADGRPLWADDEWIPERTIRDIASGRTSPSDSRIQRFTIAAVRLAASRLIEHSISPPRTAPGSPYLDTVGTLSLYADNAATLSRCAYFGCELPKRRRSRFCSEAHKKASAREVARMARG
jgi:hypothetical protein